MDSEVTDYLREAEFDDAIKIKNWLGMALSFWVGQLDVNCPASGGIGVGWCSIVGCVGPLGLSAIGGRTATSGKR